MASISFLLPITASVAIVLRALQGLGAGAATVASLAMISSSVAVERRGRAFASIYGGELAGMAVGPLVGSIVGVHYMWAMFLASGLLSLRRLHSRPPHPRTATATAERGRPGREPTAR